MAQTRSELQASVTGYSRIVRWMKVLLPVAAIVLVAAIFLIDRGSEESLFSPEEIARLGAGMQLENPKFSGVTEGGEPFVVTARRALPDGPVPDLIELEAPEGQITLGENRVLDGRSDAGVISRAKQELTLTGSVVLHTSDGYRAQTERLIFDIEDHSAYVPVPISGFGPNGSIEAGSMRVLRDESDDPERSNAMVILFEKGVRVVFIQSEAR